MGAIVFEGAARFLVLLHAAAAIVLIGASTHHAWIGWLALRGKPRPRLMRIYGAVQATSGLLVVLLGGLTYPTFRVRARAEYLDLHAPWASQLFEAKEHLGAIGLALMIGAFSLGRALEPERQRALLPTYVGLVGLAAVIVWFNTLSGLWITMVRGV